MDFLTWIFAILTRFTPMDTDKASVLKQKASEWMRNKIFPTKDGSIYDGDPSKLKDDVTGVYKFLQTHLNEWYTQLLLAILFIPVCVWIQDKISPMHDDDDDDDTTRI